MDELDKALQALEEATALEALDSAKGKKSYAKAPLEREADGKLRKAYLVKVEAPLEVTPTEAPPPLHPRDLVGRRLLLWISCYPGKTVVEIAKGCNPPTLSSALIPLLTSWVKEGRIRRTSKGMSATYTVATY